MSFSDVQVALAKNLFAIIKDKTALFVADVSGDELWEIYQNSFPAGTNPIFRTRREHDCGCCRNFISSFGNVVVIENNKTRSIWNVGVKDVAFQFVFDAMSFAVEKAGIKDRFYTKLAKFGVEVNYEKLVDNTVRSWNHFFVALPKSFVDTSNKSAPELTGEYREQRNVFKRSLTELSSSSVEVVLDLILQNSLYKGEEWKAVLGQFLALHNEFSKLSPDQQDVFCWEKPSTIGVAVSKIRNHSIGTLLIDISNGVDLNEAVRKYEAMVAPANYKRPKAIYTTSMVDAAKKTIGELGMTNSLGRRFATIRDLTINNVLFADNSTKIIDVFGGLKANVPVRPQSFDKIEEVSIEKFISDILPRSSGVELFVENKHTTNLVSLIAPQSKDSPSMFKWSNGFSWAYTGNITDSDITERVKNAGGRVDGVLRFSHSWNYDDMRNASLMDLHVFLPGSSQPRRALQDGLEIHDEYGNSERVGWNHRTHTRSGGVQDVDYVREAPRGYIPVENITFPSIERLPEGVFTLRIHNWRFRTPTTGGVKAEVAFGGQVYSFVRKEPLKNREWITIAKISLRGGRFDIVEMMESTSTPLVEWGISTNRFHPVSVCMFSPNFWDCQTGIGNKHYFFMLKDCKNDTQPNGFYNEFLSNDLATHKRVFEALGSAMKVEASDEQLSGLGFSSTQRNSVVCRVTGHTTRTIRITF